jgi:hypothetical protein
MSDAVVAMITDALPQEVEDFFRKHFDLVHSTALAITGSREDADDLVQTACVANSTIMLRSESDSALPRPSIRVVRKRDTATAR